MSEPETLKERSERLATGPRLTELDRLLASIEGDLPAGDPGDLSALSMLLVDATLEWDEAALELAFGELQRLAALCVEDRSRSAAASEGRLLSLIDTARWGLERALPVELMGQFVEPQSRGHEFLKLIAEQGGRSNTALSGELDISPSAVSHVGRRLISIGLARKRRVGRTNQWLITPRGVQVLAVLDAGGVIRPTREHRQLQT